MGSKVSGYQLRERIRELSSNIEVAVRTFKDSFYAFPGESKPSPTECSERLRKLEVELATAQSEQQRFNQQVRIDVLGQTMSLSQGVKLLGGIGRIEKTWRDATGSNERYNGYGNQLVRNTHEVRAERTIPVSQLLEQASASAKFASALRSAISKGNASEVELS